MNSFQSLKQWLLLVLLILYTRKTSYKTRYAQFKVRPIVCFIAYIFLISFHIAAEEAKQWYLLSQLRFVYADISKGHLSKFWWTKIASTSDVNPTLHAA